MARRGGEHAGIILCSGNGRQKSCLEQIYLWKPERILVWTPGAEERTTWRAIIEDPLWQKLDAVAAGKVTQIPWIPIAARQQSRHRRLVAGATALPEDLDLATPGKADTH
jgi:iron complex transport system substrate-binding protein